MAQIRGTDRKPIDFVVQTTDPQREYQSAIGRVTIGPYQPGDEASIVACFNTVFRQNRTLEQWNWEFRDNPNGIHSYVGKLDDGRVVSQFCGLPVKTKVGSETLIFAQIVDLMVHPDCREGLKKRGLFARTLLAHAYDLGRYDREIVQFGLPNPIAYRIGVQTCYFVPLTKIYTHSKRVTPDAALDPLPSSTSGLRQEFRVGFSQRFGAEHDALWEKVKARHGVICHRDQIYMNWRYHDNPSWTYDVIEVRTPAGELCGLAVTRARWLDDPELIVADWLVDTSALGAEAALIEACEHRARATGHEKVRCLLNHMAPESRTFEDAGYDLETTKEFFRLVGHSYAPGAVTEDELNRYWYYTMGDFDVV